MSDEANTTESVISEIVEKIPKTVETENGNITVRILEGDRVDYEFRPREDIAAYELARCLPALLMLILTDRVDEFIVKQLPEECQRHWRVKVHETVSNGTAGVAVEGGDPELNAMAGSSGSSDAGA